MLEQAAQKQLSSPSTESQKPEVLRHSELNRSLNTSSAYEEREETSSVNADNEEPDVQEVERIRSILEETNKCYFCEYKAPVPWIHPSKGVNLSGMDIWDLGGQKKVNGLLDWSLFRRQSPWKYPLCLGLCGLIALAGL